MSSFLRSVVLGSTESTYKDIIKIDVKEKDTDWVHVGRSCWYDFLKHDNVLSGCVKAGNFFA